MTSPVRRTLLLEALHARQTPRIPWIPYLSGHVARLAGASVVETFHSAELLARGVLVAAEQYDADGVPLLADPQFEAEALGCAVQWTAEYLPSLTGPALAKHDSGAAIPLAIPTERDGRWPVLLAAARLVRRELGDRALLGLLSGPCTLAQHLRGIRLFTDLLKAPDFAARLFAFCGQVAAEQARIYGEVIGCDVVAIVDSAATMLKPEYFTRYVSPNLQPALERIHRAGCTSSLWA